MVDNIAHRLVATTTLVARLDAASAGADAAAERPAG